MSDQKEQKKRQIFEIKTLIHGFCEKYLNAELEGFCFNICDKLSRKRKLDMLRTKNDIWAASIVWVVARLNFLFDKRNKYHIESDQILDYFQTKSTTTGNKATQIQKMCNLPMGAEGFCFKVVSDAVSEYKAKYWFFSSELWLKIRAKGSLLREQSLPPKPKNDETIFEKKGA